MIVYLISEKIILVIGLGIEIVFTIAINSKLEESTCKDACDLAEGVMKDSFAFMIFAEFVLCLKIVKFRTFVEHHRLFAKRSRFLKRAHRTVDSL